MISNTIRPCVVENQSSAVLAIAYGMLRCVQDMRDVSECRGRSRQNGDVVWSDCITFRWTERIGGQSISEKLTDPFSYSFGFGGLVGELLGQQFPGAAKVEPAAVSWPSRSATRFAVSEST